MRTRQVLSLVFLLVLAACAADGSGGPQAPMSGGVAEAPQAPVAPSPASPQPLDRVVIRFDGFSATQTTAILEGCRDWRSEGVTCEEEAADDPALPSFTVVLDTALECEKNEEGRAVLGEADFAARTIVLHQRCIAEMAAISFHTSALVLRGVAAHEIGHMLGIWRHVPKECGGEDRLVTDRGVEICGIASMNPLFNTDLIGAVTGFDHLAFTYRNAATSVIGQTSQALRHAHAPGEPDCSYGVQL